MYLKNLSFSVLGTTNYLGVNVTIDGNTIKVWDGAQDTNNINIKSYELLGQPTWLGPNSIEVKVVLRSDIKIDSFITLPPTFYNTGENEALANAGSSLGGFMTFSGKFRVRKVTHYGNSRTPDALSWNTTIEALFENSTNGQTQAAQQGAAANSSVGGIGSDFVAGGGQAPAFKRSLRRWYPND
jgi:hypothetical protein